MQASNRVSLQSRLLTHIVKTCFCLAICPFLIPGSVTYAAELPDVVHNDGPGQSALLGLANTVYQNLGGDGDTSGTDEGYAPDFAYLDRSLIGRQVAGVSQLTNNVKAGKDIGQNETLYFVLEKSQLRLRRADDFSTEALDARGTDNASGPVVEDANGQAGSLQDTADDDMNNKIRKRQESTTRVWLTGNTCRQPIPNGTVVPTTHPQLIMYVSNSTDNQKPGPDSTEGLVTNATGISFDSGYAEFDFNTTSSLYISIAAPLLDNNWIGSWHFEIAASVEGPYHSYNNTDPFLFMVDTDSDSTLFITSDLGTSDSTEAIEKWSQNNPFKMYAFEAGDWTLTSGLEHSYCAIVEYFSSNATKDFTINSKITTRFGDGHLPRTQFNVQNLDAAKTYNGFVVVEENNLTSVLPGVGIVRGGGKVFQPFRWTTKVDDSCQVIFDLDFCDTVAYAVPSSSNFKDNDTGLAEIYDSKARTYYENFQKSLAQVACNTTGEAQYSLARTCTDCENDYKSWLCTVLIPRCEDWSATDTWLQPRRINEPLSDGSLTYNGNVTGAFNDTRRDRVAYNQSRNPFIDELISPGPYKELKPCEDLCFDIVRSCPPQLGFGCPNAPGRDMDYGTRDVKGNQLTCSFPGAVVKLNVEAGVGTLSSHMLTTVVVVLGVMAAVWV